MATITKKEIAAKQKDAFIETLHARFDKNKKRHAQILWDEVEKKLLNHPGKLWSLYQMELTGGEPDVVDCYKKTGEYVFYDCSPESPSLRRSICYDREGLESRKEHKPAHNALDMAVEMGIEILTEEEYRFLQTLGTFDSKTSSWIKTPDEIRRLGGALFGDKRYNHVFIYHNSAPSYYTARGFRGKLVI